MKTLKEQDDMVEKLMRDRAQVCCCCEESDRSYNNNGKPNRWYCCRKYNLGTGKKVLVRVDKLACKYFYLDYDI